MKVVRFGSAALSGVRRFSWTIFIGVDMVPIFSFALVSVVILAVMTLLPWFLSRRRHSRLARWLHLDE